MYLSGCALLLMYGFAPLFVCRLCIVAPTGSAGRFTATSVSYPRLVGLLFCHQAEQLACFVRFGCRLFYSVYICGSSLVQYRAISLYRVSQEECARLRESVPYVKIYRYNQKHLCPKLNGYGDKGQRKVWSSCGSTYCTWLAWRNTHTLRIVRPCLQSAQARSSLRLHM